MASLGTLRKNITEMRLGVVSDLRVADGEIATSFAFVINLALVTTPWLIDGPTMAMTFEFEMNR